MFIVGASAQARAREGGGAQAARTNVTDSNVLGYGSPKEC